MRRTTLNLELQITEEIHTEALISIEEMSVMMANKLLAQLGIEVSLENSFSRFL